MTYSERIKGILSTLGPGILFAGAAIGGSHLVQSTRAGANYGFTLTGVIILILILKYPFFQYSHRYAARTGKSLVEGYRDLGRWVLGLFFFCRDCWCHKCCCGCFGNRGLSVLSYELVFSSGYFQCRNSVNRSVDDHY